MDQVSIALFVGNVFPSALLDGYNEQDELLLRLLKYVGEGHALFILEKAVLLIIPYVPGI
ncbi:hypothetical protein DMA11_21605 [Marinilabiliaceae bacterium JC017]|nr:hypothetical protein DMA11_21605 [Marinilabiliaceae bacterium JC017]